MGSETESGKVASIVEDMPVSGKNGGEDDRITFRADKEKLLEAADAVGEVPSVYIRKSVEMRMAGTGKDMNNGEFLQFMKAAEDMGLSGLAILKKATEGLKAGKLDLRYGEKGRLFVSNQMGENEQGGQ